MKHYDLCIIGGGPAGMAAAMRAMDLQKRVLLVEKDELGGCGLRNGALSSKTWWELARRHDNSVKYAAESGISLPPPDILSLQNKVDAAMKHMNAQWELAVEAANKLPGAGHLDIEFGTGQIRGPHQIAIIRPDSLLHVGADHILLATGSRPRPMPNLPTDERDILSSDSIEHLQSFPKSLVIFGAGIIGCEYATIFALLGQTEVHLVEKAPRILPSEDEDVAIEVERQFSRIGIRIHTHATVEKVEASGGKVNFALRFDDGRLCSYETEKAMVAQGRIPNTEGLGLECTQVRVSDRGHVICCGNEAQTHAQDIYVAGDLSADISLVNIAELEGRHAVEQMFGLHPPPLCYDNISSIMFLQPEVAGVGMNESEARRRNQPYKAAKVYYDSIPRAVAMGRTEGFVKVLVEPGSHRILGMRALGEHAGSVIQAAALMIKQGIPVEALADLLHPHPSITEGIQECARLIIGNELRKGTRNSTWEWNPAGEVLR